MQEIDNFKQIFNFTTTESSTVINLVEEGSRARIRYLNIIGNGVNLISFDKNCSVQVGQFFLQSSQCKKNADGVIVFENSKGKNLLLCEMKSSGRGVFNSAFQQVFSSYLKMCMLLSMCDNFNISDYTVFFLFTSQDGADLAQSINELEQIDVSKRTFVDNVRLDLLKGKRVKFPLRTIPHKISFLHRVFIDKEVVCQLLTSSTDTINFDISLIP